MTFKKISQFETKKGVFQTEYIHEKTGARHFHISVEGVENVFNIVFNTPIENNKGIPHILEHIVLEGSKKYPINNMFYKLSDKNFETMMNAGTYNNFTTYYFATNIESGFFNLADVYLDSTLNPLISEASFLQEGFRYEHDEKTNRLKFSGVVYNEMMAWVGKKDIQLSHELEAELIEPHPLTTYAGGDPLEIADVTYQEILDFHKKYYNPSNSTTFTVGSIDVEKIHQKLDEFFDKFEKQEIYVLPPMKFKHNDYFVKEVHHAGDQICSGVLAINFGKDNISNSIEDFGIHKAVNALAMEKVCDYFTQNNAGVLLNGFNNTLIHGNSILMADIQFEEKSDVSKFWDLWTFAWQRIVEDGIDEKIIDSFFEKIIIKYDVELERNYALQMNNAFFYYTMQGEKDYHLRNTRDYYVKMKESFKNTNILIEIINQKVLSKKNAVLVYSTEDENYITKYNQKITNKETLRNQQYSAEEKKILVERLAELRAKEVVSDASLPSVTLLKSNVLPEVNHQHKVVSINGSKVKINTFNDTDIRARVELQYPIVAKNEEELLFELIQENLWENSAFKGMSRDESNIWKKEGVSVMNHYTTMRTEKEQKTVYQVVYLVGYKSSVGMLAEKALKVRAIQDFSDKEDFQKTLNKIIFEKQESLMQDIVSFVTMFSKLNESGNTLKYLEEVKLLEKLKSIANELENNDTSTYDRFVKYYNSSERINAKINVAILDDDDGSAFNLLKESNLLGQSDDLTEEKLCELVTVNNTENKDIVLVTETSSAFTAYSIGGMPSINNLEDYIQMQIATNYLTEYATETIRVKMGAYGAWVRSIDGSMVFVAYRTPKPLESIEYYKTLIDEVLNAEVNIELLDASKRKAFGDFLLYNSKRAIARKEDLSWLVNQNMREVAIEKMNIITMFSKENFKNILVKYFSNNKNETYSCIATNTDFVNSNPEMDKFEKIKFPF